MSSFQIVALMVVAYIILIAAVSVIARKAGATSEGFVRGGRVFPAAVIGLFMASEVVGTSASIGTAQGAYADGISAAWNLGALGIGFIVFAVLFAKRFKQLDEVTISGALERAYGAGVRRAASVTMIASLLLVATAAYVSGGAMISALLGIDAGWAVVIVGVLSSVYVVIGGMRSVIYTNLINVIVKVAGIVVVAVSAYFAAGGYEGIHVSLPSRMLDWDGVGWNQMGAWLVAGGGAMFATQYVVQAMTAVDDEGKARNAGLYTSLVLIPYGVLAAFIGVCAAVVHPDIDSLQALPSMVVDLSPLLQGVAVTGLIASVFGLISALTIGSSTLLLKDFYQPYFNTSGDERKAVRFARLATLGCGLIPVAAALFASDVLGVTFLAKALRASLAVFVVLMFYRPSYGSRQGALVSLCLSLPAVVGWYLAGDPFGVDNAYIAILTPLLVMTIAQLSGRGTKASTPIARTPATAAAVSAAGSFREGRARTR
ncbi:sodium:solute symporter family protein [Streptomyces sp. DASNCL29]|uniref:sodium:solute symporter family protein n=1 Tax=Streptomyces sp. DASNCL29 TaxID=2583819 RepID=UPI00110F92FC|nr:sodium:solute symporter family protein [Streptomyces sp. DASNCL29]TMU98696.1 sodium:solute symporter family protein [Streptomyces sp. DASNCL29]